MMVMERHNGYPSVRLTANRLPGVSAAEARSLCDKLAEQEFGTKNFKLVWRAR
jgi:hypothetical protein